jgi:hypothetical protein
LAVIEAERQPGGVRDFVRLVKVERAQVGVVQGGGGEKHWVDAKRAVLRYFIVLTPGVDHSVPDTWRLMIMGGLYIELALLDSRI